MMDLKMMDLWTDISCCEVLSQQKILLHKVVNPTLQKIYESHIWGYLDKEFSFPKINKNEKNLVC